MAQLTRRDLSLFSRRRLTTNVGNNRSGERDPLPSKDGNRVNRNSRRSDAFGFQRPNNYSRQDRTLGTDLVASQFTYYNLDITLGIKSSRDVLTLEKFGNDGRLAFDKQIRDLENKVSSTTFRNVTASLAYVYSLTKGDVQQLLDLRIPSRLSKSATIDPFQILDELLKYLIDRYGQRNQANRSFYNLAALKQSDKDTFSVYYSKFQKYRIRVYLTTESKKQLLEGSLNYCYSNRLIDGVVCASLKDLVTKLYNIKDGFTRLEASKPARTESNLQYRNRDRGGRRCSRSSSTSNIGATNNSNLLLLSELLQKYRDLKLLTDDKRNKLIRSSYYLRYREHGYYSRDPQYIFKKYQILLRANVIAATTATTTLTTTTRSIQGNSETST